MKVIGLNARGEEEIFPQVWINRRSGDLFAVMPWMEIMQDQAISTMSAGSSMRAVYGALSQVGWLIENKHGVYFGVGLRAEQEFEKVGEL